MIDILIVILLAVITFFTGTFMEKRHLRSINMREEEAIFQLFTSDAFTTREENVERMKFVGGSCVIAADKFKMILGGLRSFFGGKVSSFESLTERARREALLRMRAQAPDADMIINGRIQLCEIGQGQVEAIAYGTAVYLKRPA